jgi:hypothetical protein
MHKKKTINKSLRNAVWISEFGVSGIGKCYCCQLETVTMGNFQCGHIIAESRGGKTILQNLKPVCALCNTSMGVRNLHEFAVTNGYRRSPAAYASYIISAGVLCLFAYYAIAHHGQIYR